MSSFLNELHLAMEYLRDSIILSIPPHIDDRRQPFPDDFSYFS